MGHTINITQSLEQAGDASYVVKMVVNKSEEVEVIEFNYEKTNQIYPIYRSLIDYLSKQENVHIKLKTDSEAFVYEINSLPNKNARLLQMLKETLERRNITLEATLI